MNIAFIGLGIMGSRMATNLLKGGQLLTIYNRTPKELSVVGARVAETAAAAVEDADLVFSMLSTPEVVGHMFLKEDGLLSVMKPSAVWVDCSTVNPSFSRECHSAATQRSIAFLDAPVAGTKPHAENAELVFFVGGKNKTLEIVRPYLDLMSKKVMHLGAAGNGSRFKMLVNMMLAESMVVFSEAVSLGERMGLDRNFLLDTLPNLVVAAPFTKMKADAMRSDEYEVQFPLEWMYKDLHLATQTAYELGQPLYLANLTKELFAQANQAGLGRLDFAAIHRQLTS